MAITGKDNAFDIINRSGQFNVAQKEVIRKAIDALDATGGGGGSTEITLASGEPLTVNDGDVINLTLTGDSESGYVIGIEVTPGV